MDWVAQEELSKRFGTTGHHIGKLLLHTGFKENKEVTQKALDECYAKVDGKKVWVLLNKRQEEALMKSSDVIDFDIYRDELKMLHYI